MTDNVKDQYFRNSYLLVHDSPTSADDSSSAGSQAPTPKGSFPVPGQGSVSVPFHVETPKGDESSKTEPLGIIVSSRQSNRPALKLEIGPESCSFIKYEGDEREVLATTDKPSALLDKHSQRYWLSIDKNRRLLRMGKGYMLDRLVEFERQLPAPPHDRNKDPFAWIGDLIEITFENLKLPPGNDRRKSSQIAIWKFPVTNDLPALVVATDEISLDDLDHGSATVIANLTTECERLYANVAGRRVALGGPDFPDMADAINHSIVTPGCICYEKLRAKAGVFSSPNGPGEDGHKGRMTYLRITVGENRGNSPGVPFVLEIWPGGHFSPIHDHSDCDAIIKVLHGNITAEFYRGLSKHETSPYETTRLVAGDVTWLNERQFQTHRLYNRNPPGQMCATIQCYAYANHDNTHYEYFDYLTDDGVLKQFTPNSDWQYTDFKRLLRVEWDRHLATRPADEVS